MSPNMKISLLALVASTAVAVPHNGGHSRFHHSSAGYVGPTGGWSNQNTTQPAPTGTGPAVPPGGSPTTTLEETSYSTQTIVSTIYATKPKSDAVAAAAADVSTSSAACGPATVYVTATEKVTVTVPAGDVSSSSAAVPEVSSATTPSPKPVYVTVSPSPVAAPESSKPAVSKEEQKPTYAPVPKPPTSSIASPPAEAPKPSAPPAPAPAPSSASPSPSPAPAPAPAPSSAAPAPAPSSAAPAPAPSSASPAPVPSSAAPSSAAPSPSATPSSSGPGYSGGKRGLAYRWDGAADCKSFASKMNAGFAWNWEADSRGDIGGIPFIPTLRTLANAGDWSSKVDAAVKGGSKVVFGFNEPDKPDQANLSPAAACSAWKQYMNPIASKYPDVQVVGPSVSSDVAKGAGLDWLSQFKSQCPDAVYHASNIHWYGYGSATFEDFKGFVEQAISQFGKVWVTEFGLVNQGTAASQAFLEKALPYLDSNPDCQGYSYFAVGQFDPAFNMLGTGNALSEVGKLYVS